MSYMLIKMLHVSCVMVSYSLFLVRGIWMLQESEKLQRSWIKILPHVNDTVLLGSAVALAMMIQQNPVEHPWLAAKVAGLLLYIILGMVAMRFAKTRKVKIVAWIAAQCVFVYIVFVALTKSPVLGML